MNVKHKKVSMWNSKTISIVSLISFVTVLLIILFSNRYMTSYVEYEAQSQKNRYELKALGESLADASDYLTEEVRKYSVTGEIEHLYNYWYEVNEAKNRETVIDTLTNYNPPENERELLEEAKKYSDILIKTETCSMKMVMLSREQSDEDYKNDEKLYKYTSYVMSFELPKGYAALSLKEMHDKAMEILYDSSYINAKNLIMNPIEEFQKTMNARLNSEVNQATAGRQHASALQICCLIIVVLLIGVLLVVLNRLYIQPLKEYTEDLSKANRQDDTNFNFIKVRVMPHGAFELKEFGRLFNNIACLLHKELDNRAKAEEKMRISRDEADKANNAKSDFLAHMSHELRTPLNAIIGYLYLLSGSELDEKQSRYCENIRLSSESLLGLISDILDFSKIESGNITFENIDFKLLELTKEVYSIMKNGARQKNLNFRLDITGDIPSVIKGDSLKLRQVLMNLIGNALKFTSKGCITLEVKMLENVGDEYLFEFGVRDTGIGVSNDERKKIFEPFVQSDVSVTRKYGGTGLGLAICRMIIEEASGGKETLELESELGKGSYFYFKMKFATGNENAEYEAKGIETYKNIQGSKTVLLVDDKEINLAVESEIIKNYGVSVTTAQSGNEALKLAESRAFDMIIMDIRMPDMDGYEATGRIRKMKQYKYTPIIALSADVVAGVAEKAIEAGMNYYAAKPLKPEKLCELMQKYFNSSADLPETLYAENGRFFSYNECLKNLNGNERVLLKITDKFLSSHKNNANYIREHISSGNFGNASSILHDIIGLSGNLCCKELHNISCRLSDHLKQQKNDSIDEFMQIWHETINEMQEYVNANSYFLEINSSDKLSADILHSFIASCNDYDIAAVDLFERYRSDFKEKLSKKDFCVIEEAIQKYDFESIIELLNEWR